MAAVDFTTISCEPSIAHLAKGEPYFAIFVPVLMTLCMLGLKLVAFFCLSL